MTPQWFFLFAFSSTFSSQCLNSISQHTIYLLNDLTFYSLIQSIFIKWTVHSQYEFRSNSTIGGWCWWYSRCYYSPLTNNMKMVRAHLIRIYIKIAQYVFGWLMFTLEKHYQCYGPVENLQRGWLFLKRPKNYYCLKLKHSKLDTVLLFLFVLSHSLFAFCRSS